MSRHIAIMSSRRKGSEGMGWGLRDRCRFSRDFDAGTLLTISQQALHENTRAKLGVSSGRSAPLSTPLKLYEFDETNGDWPFRQMRCLMRVANAARTITRYANTQKQGGGGTSSVYWNIGMYAYMFDEGLPSRSRNATFQRSRGQAQHRKRTQVVWRNFTAHALKLGQDATASPQLQSVCSEISLQPVSFVAVELVDYQYLFEMKEH